MSQELKIAIIGLDTSHSTEFPAMMQDPEKQQVKGLRAVTCLRFDTPFQTTEGLDARQAYLESIGVKVTLDFDEAVADCDAIMIEINDPSLHLEYFEKCAPLGKPIYLDKPFADTVENMKKIIELADKYQVRFFTASSLRFEFDLNNALKIMPDPEAVTAWGTFGMPPAGSEIVWYGCHTFEILERALGRGAKTVTGSKVNNGYIFNITYNDARRGTVELFPGTHYGAVLRKSKEDPVAVRCTGKVPFYRSLMEEVFNFFIHGSDPVPLADAVEVMSMIEAARKSIISGQPEAVYQD